MGDQEESEKSMTVISEKLCDRCSKKPIDKEYTLSVHIEELLPRGGGIVTGGELRKRFDYCNKCKRSILNRLLTILNENETTNTL